MTRQELANHILIDPTVCFGHPVIRGTRIWVSLIVDNLAEGASEDEILQTYPQLTKADVRAGPGLRGRDDSGASASTRGRGRPVRFKLDENLPEVLASLLAEAGHDVATVLQEELSGCDDRKLFELCQREGRALVTLDLDFANPLNFPPESAAGIIVLRPPRPLFSLLRSVLGHVVKRIETEELRGRLWIVEPTSLRIYDPGED